METNYTFFYVEANVVCIIIFLLLFFRGLTTIGWQSKQRIFVNITVSHILYFAIDIIGTLANGGYIPKTYLTAAFVNVGVAVFLSAITGSWFVYVELSQGAEYIKRFKARLLAMAPAMAVTVVLLFLFIFFPSVVLDDENNVTTIYYALFLAVPVLYVIASATRGFTRAFRKENYAVRAQYLVTAMYPVIISVVGVIETIWFMAPMFCFSSSIMMLYVYIISLNDQVSIDELTHLNNRTQLKKYIVSEHSKQGDKTIRYVLMIDLNRFKYINDQFGHIEGDTALKRTADALKIACSDNPFKTFIARYGGDEFIIIAKTESEELVNELSKTIKETLVRLNEEAGAEYELTASIGSACYCGDISDFQAALNKADEALYEEKAKRVAPAK